MSEEVSITLPTPSVFIVLEQEQEKSKDDLEKWEIELRKATTYEDTDNALRQIARYKGEIRAYEIALRLLTPFSFDLD